MGFDPNFCKYMPLKVAQQRKHLGNLGPRRYYRAYVQEFMDEARHGGYLVAYNHPCWSMEAEEDVLSYQGCFSLEMFNTGSQLTSGGESNLALFDKLLRRGKFLFVHGADDNHNKEPFGTLLCDSFGAWTQVLAKDLEYQSVIEALEKGDFYATTGPTITNLTFDRNHATLDCTPAQRIIAHGSPKVARNICNPDGSPVTHAEFDIPDKAPYVYFSVLIADGKAARTRAFRPEEFRR